MTDNEPYWTLAETVVWICTRDFTRVSSIGDIRSDAALAEETYKLLSEKTRTVVDPPDLNEIRDGAPKANWNVSGSADDQIIERARDGDVRAIGRRKWEGPLERIPPAEFIGLRIRTIPDGLERGQSIDWLDVQFRRADVMQQWPSGLAMAPALEGQDGEPTAEPRTSTQPHHEPPAKQDEPAPHTAAEIDIIQGDTREEKPDALDGAGEQKTDKAKSITLKRARGYDKQDAPLLKQMHKMINSGKADNVPYAADAMAPKAVGKGKPASKSKRLEQKYMKKYKT